MINQVMLVGRIAKIEKLENEECKVTLAIHRNSKNSEGIYETDFIKVLLFPSISEKINKYCEKGNLMGVHGKLRCSVENKELEIVADKVTFLSSKENEGGEK